MDHEEIKILAAFKNRDAKAFAHIFKLHRKALVYFADRIIGVRQEAEDIVADSFMKLWARHADFESMPAIKSFLYVVTKNACFDFLKYSKKVSASQKEFSYWAGDKEVEILHLMYKAELLAELDREIQLLPPKCRNIFQLAFYEGLNTMEIAAKLGLSDQTVRNQKAKAVQIIKAAFFKKNLALAFLLCSIAHSSVA
ncbi:MAG TPA: RNA polymerase sigma-70 factor [Chitinophagaceae bacterium]|nr:RNA polymerase sigma-70 factor [Chitinophagaceae bacterium]